MYFNKKSLTTLCAAFIEFPVAGFCGENNAPQGVPPASTMINTRSVCHENNVKNVFPLHSICQDFSLIHVTHKKKKKKEKHKTFS